MPGVSSLIWSGCNRGLDQELSFEHLGNDDDDYDADIAAGQYEQYELGEISAGQWECLVKYARGALRASLLSPLLIPHRQHALEDIISKHKLPGN